MADKTHSPRLAVLIDAENISASIADGLFEEVAKIGDAVIRRIYGNFADTHTKSWVEVLARHGIVVQQQFPTATGKNASDIALVIDAMDLLYSGGLDVFCIVSSDSDFAPLALRLRESGIRVFGFGRQAASERYRYACHSFIPTDDFARLTETPAQHSTTPASALPAPPAVKQTTQTPPKPAAKAGTAKPAPSVPATQPPSAATPILKRAVTKIDSAGGWVDLTRLGQQLSGLKPSQYGSAKLSTLVKKTGAFDVETLANNQIRIRSKIQTAKQTDSAQ